MESNVQYGKQIITGMTNLSDSGKVKLHGDRRAKIITMITRINVNKDVSRALRHKIII